ncbi:MAG: methyl-accepting chemotaxis protein [Lachnospiraceae bacterium]|nr:methyl-accepting chemotaxis protein [Lachnospiraceae bacterium]
MKLRTKLSLLFGIVVLFVVVIVGTVTYTKSTEMGIADAKNTMQVSANLAASEIEGKLDDFMKMAQVSGYDSVFTTAPDETISKHIDILAENYAFTSGNVVDRNGISRKDGTDFSDRDYIKNALEGKTNISDLTVSKYTGNYGFSVASPVYAENNKISGAVYFRMDADFMRNILDQISISKNSYTYLVDGDGMVIVHPDETQIGTYNITDKKEGLGSIADMILSQNSGSGTYTRKNTEYICGYSPVAGTNGWTVVVTAPKEDFMAPIYQTMRTFLVVDILALVIAMILAACFSEQIGKAVQHVSRQLAYLSSGDLEHEIEMSKHKDEIGQLQNSARKLQQTFKEMIGETNRILEGMAGYDLTQAAMNAYPGDFNRLSDSVNCIRVIIQDLIRRVQESASSVGTGSSQLADAADALASGTVTQATSINQLVANVEDMTDCIMRNSENEVNVQERLQQLDHLIIDGNGKMVHLRDVVSQVESMSSDIQSIVSTIESIAFQINILALNASIEAAHAGENGRGFAVVADEISDLAAKTTEASKQTSELIVNCLQQIESAMTCADSTSEYLKDIVENSNHISEVFKNISEDTKEQADKSSHIKLEISNISDVVQTNTATAEETAAATQELSEQAKNLKEMISKFRV